MITNEKEIDVYLHETTSGVKILLDHDASGSGRGYALIGKGKAVISMIDDSKAVKNKILALENERYALFENLNEKTKEINLKIMALKNMRED